MNEGQKKIRPIYKFTFLLCFKCWENSNLIALPTKVMQLNSITICPHNISCLEKYEGLYLSDKFKSPNSRNITLDNDRFL